MSRRAGLAVIVALLAGSAARADPQTHVGLDLRTDRRVHPLRVVAGHRHRNLDASLVLDPLVFADGEHDGDLTVEWHPCARRLAALAGWRVNTVGVAGGHQWQERSLLGVTAPLGRWRSFGATFGAELSILWVKHGGGLPASWLGVDRATLERIHLGMFVRLEYVVAR